MSVSVPRTLVKRKREFTIHLQERIENAYIENDDALKILRSRNVDDAFHYIDPPYCWADQGHYSGYTPEQYQELLEWCAKECKGKFMLSNYNSPLLDQYVQSYGWLKRDITHRLKAPRKSGPVKTEVIIMNYDNRTPMRLF